MKRRYLAIPLLFLFLAFLIVVQVASKRIVSPTRARIRDAGHAIMSDPAAHGMAIRAHTGPRGTPYLLCEGLSVTGEKGRILRRQLQARGLSVRTKPAVILLLHGHASRKENQLAIAERFCAAGFTCVIPDLPGHGEHAEKIATFGKKEVPLLLKLQKAAQREHHLSSKWGIFGLSQGGAVALQLAAAQPDRFTAVASLSTFANLSQTLGQTAASKSRVLGAVFPVVEWNLARRHDLSLAHISPARTARGLSLDVFLAHGEEDTFIPPMNAELIFKNLASERKKLRLVPGAKHGDVLAKGELMYADLCEFFNEAEEAE